MVIPSSCLLLVESSARFEEGVKFFLRVLVEARGNEIVVPTTEEEKP